MGVTILSLHAVGCRLTGPEPKAKKTLTGCLSKPSALGACPYSISGCGLRLLHYVPHQWCALFYRLLHSSTQHIEKVEGGERDTQLVHVNEATAV